LPAVIDTVAGFNDTPVAVITLGSIALPNTLN